MTANEMVNKVLNIALSEVGYLEKKNGTSLYDKTANAGSNNYTKYGYEMHKLYPATMDYPAAWCDTFVDWCFVQAFGVSTATKLLYKFDDYTVNSAGYYKNKGRWYTTPKKGDQIFFSNSKGGICHTGLVYEVSNGRVYTVEGNTSSASGVVANGGAVAKKSYSLDYNKIAGYGRPDYGEDIIQFTETITNLYGTVTATLLNIRKQPSTDSEIIGKHVNGDTVIICAKTNNGWYRVDYPNIGTGYISAQYVQTTEIVETPPVIIEPVTPEVITPDNTPDEWAKNIIEESYSLGIIAGDNTGDLRLHDNCTRQEFVVFLYRLYKSLK